MMTLRQHRRQRLWSIRDLANVAGVAPQTIVNIEHGHRPPRFETMRKVAAALDVPPSEIMEFVREIKRGSDGAAADG